MRCVNPYFELRIEGVYLVFIAFFYFSGNFFYMKLEFPSDQRKIFYYLCKKEMLFINTY